MGTLTKRDDYRENGWTYTETITDGETGDTVRIPPMPPNSKITCTIIAGANTGKFQSTTSPDADIIADTATWVDWPAGVKTGTYEDALISPVTAIRGVSVSGEIVIEIVF
jgi:hypothetical protein